MKVFNEKGYSATTIDDIAASANISRATFYLHFKGKLELIDMWQEQLRPKIVAYYDRLDDVLANGSREDFYAWMADSFRWFEEESTFSRIMHEVLAVERGHVKTVDLELPFIDYMPRYRNQWPKSRQREAGLRLWMMVMMYGHVVQLWKVDGHQHGIDERTFVETMTDIWFTTLTLPSDEDKAARHRAKPVAKRSATRD